MRRARRVDLSQKRIVQALRDAGATVEVLSDVGRGVPDLLVGIRMRNFLFEVKNPGGPPSKNALTPVEASWHREWRGEVVVVTTPEEAIEALRWRA